MSQYSPFKSSFPWCVMMENKLAGLEDAIAISEILNYQSLNHSHSLSHLIKCYLPTHREPRWPFRSHQIWIFKFCSIDCCESVTLTLFHWAGAKCVCSLFRVYICIFWGNCICSICTGVTSFIFALFAYFWRIVFAVFRFAYFWGIVFVVFVVGSLTRPSINQHCRQ